MHDYKKLDVWSKSMDLVKKVYDVSSSFPDKEKFGLISQMRRCSVSIPSNIAEGAGRISDKEFNNFLSYSLGSAFELETRLLLSVRLEFVKEEKVRNILSELESICKMIHSLKKRISNV
ncbi:MAG: four helix bundle protein [Cytophagales bacterium]|nr:four helix bundle protein [Cytophagales bacterium]